MSDEKLNRSHTRGREDQAGRSGDLTIYTGDQANLQAEPSSSSAKLASLESGEGLTVLEDADRARAKMGFQNQWIKARSTDGIEGFVNARQIRLEPSGESARGPDEAVAFGLDFAVGAEAVGPLIVYATEALNVRKGPSTSASRTAIALPHEPLTVIDDRRVAQGKVGNWGEWLRVQLPDGSEGHVAAWYVQTQPGPAPEATLTVFPTEDMNMRGGPSVENQIVGRLAHNAPLTAHDDPDRARELVGDYGEWLYVETEEGQRGWAAAWYLTETQAVDTTRHTLSDAGLRFIAKYEGLRTELYNDSAGHCTIGYGHLVHTGPCDGSEPEEFKRGITRERAEELLRADVARFEKAVNDRVKVELAQHQFDALVSFTFNVGAGNLANSDLLAKLNRGDYASVPDELNRWVYGGGRKLPGLVRRRRDEGTMFRDGAY